MRIHSVAHQCTVENARCEWTKFDYLHSFSLVCMNCEWKIVPFFSLATTLSLSLLIKYPVYLQFATHIVKIYILFFHFRMQFFIYCHFFICTLINASILYTWIIPLYRTYMQFKWNDFFLLCHHHDNAMEFILKAIEPVATLKSTVSMKYSCDLWLK